MKTIFFVPSIFVLLLCTVQSKPTSSDLEDIYGPLNDDENVQNDNNDYYEELPPGGEEDAGDDDDEPQLVISTPSQEFIKSVGENVTLPCEVSQGSNYVLFWRNSNGSILFQSKMRMAAPSNMDQTSNGSLHIRDIRPEDEGTYECLATISDKNKQQISHVLKLNKPPQIQRLVAKNGITTLKSGETLELTCEATGSPKPVVSWHRKWHGGAQERLDGEGELLIISDIKHRDAGQYRCFADNKIGQPAIEQIDIKVEFKPVVKIEKIAVSSENNMDTELKCIVHAEPRASVVWKKDGHNVHHTEHTQLEVRDHDHMLIIKGLQESDFGTYTCSAVSSVGATNENIKLVKTPAILRFIKPQSEAKDVVLTWEVQSKSKISQHELQYRKRGDTNWEKITPEVTNPEDDLYMVKYTLKGLEPGVYETRIRSENGNGWSEYSEIMPFEGVYAKHGHHKHGHKKGHKEKHITPPPTQEVNEAGEPVEDIQPELPPEFEAPEKHQESELKDVQTGASKPTGSHASLTTSSSLSLLLSIAVIIFVHNRQ